MPVVTILILIVLVCFALYIVQTYLPAPWKVPVLVLVVIVALIWVLSFFVPGLATIRVH